MWALLVVLAVASLCLVAGPPIGRRCPGRADVVILFATIEDSRAIRRIIGGDTFFGIPYRMYNS